MVPKNLKIVVAGDITIDWYCWPRETDSNAESENVNWKLYKGLKMYSQPAGATLISDMLRIIYPIKDNSGISIVSQKVDKDEVYSGPDKILHANMRLNLFPVSESNLTDKVYRVQKYLGYTTPQKTPKTKGILNDVEEADFVVIHDIGNGFRDDDKVWPKAIEEGKKPIIIYYMNIPLFRGKLWDHVIRHHWKNLILIINAEDLRNLGADISRSLSWEKTALDFLWEVDNNNKLNCIKRLRDVIVRFNLEGAIHYKGEDRSHSKLYFDPSKVENEYWDDKKLGTMKGISLVFVSSLTSKLIDNFENGNISDVALKEGIKFGLTKSREYVKIGHGKEKKYNEKIKNSEKIDPIFFSQIFRNLFDLKKNQVERLSHHFESVGLPINKEESDPHRWFILNQKATENNKRMIDVAKKIVLEGASTLKNCPIAVFGKLNTVDRTEIESFRSIWSIMEEYINFSKTSIPLPIAVFGYPGSGKTFAITEIAKTIDSERVKDIKFNISQFTSVSDLSSAFHEIRDISLEGQIPLVFFDEFDCTFQSQRLGWIQYFLAPMQEGKFIEHGHNHPIGKSILVFAGGVYESYNDFCVKTKKAKDAKNFSEKCPDFISRLRGYVNILGPNKIDKDDSAFIIRRAIILRSLIEKKTPNIITWTKEPEDDKLRGIADIDPNLVEDLLLKKDYNHGVRSMEAIIDMSIIRNNAWKKASLPPKHLMEIHVEYKDKNS